MDILRRHYEKLVLGLFLLVLLGVSWLLLAGIRKTRSEIKGFERNFRRLQAKGNGKEIALYTQKDFHALDFLEFADLHWDTHVDRKNGDLMDPRQYMRCANPECHYFILYDMDVCPFCHTKQGPKAEEEKNKIGKDSDGDGIPDSYEKKYKFLNPNVAADANRDQDKDGFTNLEEFLAKTDPTDPKSHPSLATRLRFIRTVKKPLGIVFTKVLRTDPENPNKWDIFVNVKGKNGLWRTQVRRLGDKIKNYVIKEVHYKTKRVHDASLGADITKDVSTLVIQKGNEEPIVLKRNDMKNFERGVAVVFLYLTNLYSPRQCKQIVVVEGDTFTLEGIAPGGKNKKKKNEKAEYVLVSVKDDEAIVRPKGAKGKNSDIVVPKLDFTKDFIHRRAGYTNLQGGTGFGGPMAPGAMPPGVQRMGMEGMMMNPGGTGARRGRLPGRLPFGMRPQGLRRR